MTTETIVICANFDKDGECPLNCTANHDGHPLTWEEINEIQGWNDH